MRQVWVDLVALVVARRVHGLEPGVSTGFFLVKSFLCLVFSTSCLVKTLKLKVGPVICLQHVVTRLAV